MNTVVEEILVVLFRVCLCLCPICPCCSFYCSLLSGADLAPASTLNTGCTELFLLTNRKKLRD